MQAPTQQFCSFEKQTALQQAYFARRRTDQSVPGKFSGPIAVTSPSQRRFVGYLQKVVKQRTDYISVRTLLLTELVISGQPYLDQESCNLTFIVENGTQIEYDHGRVGGLLSCSLAKNPNGTWMISLPTPVILRHDVSVRFYHFDQSLPSTSIIGNVAQVWRFRLIRHTISLHVHKKDVIFPSLEILLFCTQ